MITVIAACIIEVILVLLLIAALLWIGLWTIVTTAIQRIVILIGRRARKLIAGG